MMTFAGPQPLQRSDECMKPVPTVESDGPSCKSILVAGHPFHQYTKVISAGFTACGLRTTLLEWPQPADTPVKEMRKMVSQSHVRREADLQRRTNSLLLERAVTSLAPSYVLVMNGARITEKTRIFCKEHDSKLILWTYDSVSHFSHIMDYVEAYDLIYVYEPTDLKLLSNIASAKYLPLAYDPGCYFPTAEPKRTSMDICFVGTLASTPSRVEFFKNLCQRCPDLSVSIWSDSRKWYSPMRLMDLSFAKSRRNLRFTRKSMEHEEINKIYNETKICLNVHHSQSKEGVNPRTFEILGSGGFLLTDRDLDSITGFRRGRDYVLYDSFEDLVELAHYFAENQIERTEIAQSGHHVAESIHTYAHRAKEIMNDLARRE